MSPTRSAIDRATVQLVEEGCVEVRTPGGEEVSAETLRTIFAEHGEVPDDFTLRITEKGRDALARGRP